MTTQYRIPVEETFSWQRPVKSIENDPPAVPAYGDRYIVGDTPTGDWVGNAGSIAWCSNATGPVWSYDVPSLGWQAHVDSPDAKMYKFDGATWVSDDVSGKADKVSGATPDDLAALDASGNLIDSGIAMNAVANAVAASHVQGTDQGLDTGGLNAVTAAEAKLAYDSRGIYNSVLGCIFMTL